MATDFVRLHITPLDAELIKTVIPAPVFPIARNISYHTIQTFPEKRYGFVELPQEEADKVKKRFHGVTFKGSKMRIEKARPEQRLPAAEDIETSKKQKRKSKKEAGEEDDVASGEKKSKKRKREVDVLEGVVLRDRKVKRGWTDTAPKKKTKKDDKEKKKKRPRSKYTEEEECLLKVKVPPNAVKNLPAAELPVRKKKKKAAGRQVATVHEFEKTTKFPGFLRQVADAGARRATEFVEGKGWVDEEGDVVESVAVTAKPQAGDAGEKNSTEEPEAVEDDDDDDDDDTSSSGSSSEEEGSPAMEAAEPEAVEDDDTSSSGSSSEEEEEDTDNAVKEPQSDDDTSSSGASSEEEGTPSPGRSKKKPTPETPSAKPHPLEALYKRQDAQTPQPFSFFAAADDEGEADVVPSMPMTPFTRQDYEKRSVRSAAPTPDTTHPLRTQPRSWSFDLPLDEREEEHDASQEEGEEDGDGATGEKGSDFQKWFWENRRDLNRSWMNRRKMAAKEKRHRENKVRSKV